MNQTIQALLRHLRGTADSAGALADAELLERFALRGDGAAFAALVGRHGPMVLGVCCRLLGNPHDAEDAFQATFLVLARKAGTLGKGDPVGAWLHGVACRTAAHARADRARRRAHERRATAMPATEPTPAVLWQDLRPILDEEVRRLPDKYRVPVVLCYLGDKTYEEAAREIGCPKGTVATRLARARELLRDRLSRRGLALPAAVLAAIVTDNARAAVPAGLLQAAVEAATLSAAPAGVTMLAKGVLKAMSVAKLKAVTTLLVTATVLAAGAVALAYRGAGEGGPGRAGGAGAPDPAAEQPLSDGAKLGGAGAFPWGEPDAGVQVRLRPRQARWKAGEAPTFDIDLRNRGQQPTGVVRPAAFWEVELDGAWYGRKMERAAVQETALQPGEEVTDWLAFRLDGDWLRGIRGDDRYEAGKQGKALPLTPGKHRVRVAYHPHPDLSPLSNAVEIEVLELDRPENLPAAPGQASLAAEKAPLAVGDWSEPVDGLRGRLLLSQGRVLGDGKTRETLVYVELENVAVTHSGGVSVYFDPDGLTCELHDADGKAVPQHPTAGSGGRPGKAWVALPYDSALRLRANPYAFGRPDDFGLLIPLNNATWLIKAGDSADYSLSGTLVVSPPDGHGRADAWQGALKLPRTKVSGKGTAAGSGPALGVGKLAKESGTDASLREIQTVKPGMTRADLLKVFQEEGGLSTRAQRRYAYRGCPLVKVDVTFEAVGAPEDKLTESPKDKIATISKPFLEWPVGD